MNANRYSGISPRFNCNSLQLKRNLICKLGYCSSRWKVLCLDDFLLLSDEYCTTRKLVLYGTTYQSRIRMNIGPCLTNCRIATSLRAWWAHRSILVPKFLSLIVKNLSLRMLKMPMMFALVCLHTTCLHLQIIGHTKYYFTNTRKTSCPLVKNRLVLGLCYLLSCE